MEQIINTIKNSEVIMGDNKSKKARIAINGFGRIGRAFLKVVLASDTLEVVAINDLGDIKNMAYLLNNDTVYKKNSVASFEVLVEEMGDTEKYLLIKNIFIQNKNQSGSIISVKKIEDKKIEFISQKDATLLPWKESNIDIVIESTGLFTSYDKANIHITCGAKRVIISAPAKEAKEGEDKSVIGETVLMSVNEDKLKTCNITSNASCTTNASSPLIAILDETIGIEKAMLNTVHAYTASQSIVDGPNKKDYREGRAAAQNIVPSSTGAAIAVGKVFTQIDGKFDGIAMRVPVPAGSIVDITFIAKRNTTTEEINNILRNASKEERWKIIFLASDEELVSSDIQGSHYASIADLKMTRVVGGNLVKVLGWYDNEMGYTHTLVTHAEKVAKLI